MPQSNFLNRRDALKQTVGLIGAAALPTMPAFAQIPSFPKGPVKFILPVAAGGAADVSTRPLAIELEKSLKQTVIVDNRPGGLFQIGMQALLQAPADGHSLIYLFNSMASVQAVHKRFDLNRQLIPVTQTTVMPMVMLAPANSRFKNLADMISFGRSNQGKLSYASLGPGSMEHLKAVQVERAAGFQAENVPYKSGPDMIKALMGGEVDFVLTAASFAYTFAPKGQVRVFAVFDTRRMREMPDVPTITEAGVNVPPLNFWGGYAVHADTPPAVVQRLFDELSAAATSPSVRERMTQIGITPVTSKSVQDFRKLIADDVAWMTDVAKDLNIKPES
jgi:tripartite-type tricarboxylate transporter receptor subunit TctC